MRSCAIISVLILCCTVQLGAQNKRIFISKQGGSRNVLTFGQLGYKNYYFTNNSSLCDTLICKGKGYEACRIDKDIIKTIKGGRYYGYNKAIRATERHIRKTKAQSGELYYEFKGKQYYVNYFNGDKWGNCDLIIKQLKVN